MDDDLSCKNLQYVFEMYLSKHCLEKVLEMIYRRISRVKKDKKAVGVFHNEFLPGIRYFRKNKNSR